MYQPKGGMCRGCALKFEDCSHLDFSKMQIIEITPIVKVVRCIEYIKEVPMDE